MRPRPRLSVNTLSIPGNISAGVEPCRGNWYKLASASHRHPAVIVRTLSSGGEAGFETQSEQEYPGRLVVRS